MLVKHKALQVKRQKGIQACKIIKPEVDAITNDKAIGGLQED